MAVYWQSFNRNETYPILLLQILNCLFGQGLSSLANKMHLTTGAVDDRLYVSSIFGPSAPKIAKEICSDWNEDTIAPWEEEVEYDDEDEDESD